MPAFPQETLRRTIPSNAADTPTARITSPTNMKWFGAVGDGVADDTPAFQAAVAAGVKCFYFPSGTYLMDAPVGDFVFSLGNLSGLEFYGDGGSTVLKLGANIGRQKSVFGSGTGQTLSKIYWHDLTIDLNGLNNLQTSFGDPLRYNAFIYAFSPDITDIEIARVTVLNGSGSQIIRLGDDSTALPRRIKIHHVLFSGFGIGIPGNLQQDVSVIYVFGHDVSIFCNKFRNDPFTMSASRGHTAIEHHSGDSLSVYRNEFEYVQVPLLSAADYGDVTNASFTNNSLLNCMYAMSFDPAGSDDWSRFQFSNNQIYSALNLQLGLVYVGASGESARTRKLLEFSNNQVEISSNLSGRSFLMLVNSRWTDITVTGNSFKGLTAQAVHFEGEVLDVGVQRLVMKRNTFDSCGGLNGGAGTMPFSPTDGSPVQIYIDPANTSAFGIITCELNEFLNTLGKNYTALGHAYLGANLRAKVISGRFNSRPDDSYELFNDIGSVASVAKDITTGNISSDPVNIAIDGDITADGDLSVSNASVLAANGTITAKSTGGASAVLSLDATGAASGRRWLALSTSTGYGDPGVFALFDETAAAERFKISTAGLLKLAAYGAGTLTSDASGNITSVSDEAVKNVIGPFAGGLKEILGLLPIKFGYKRDSGLDPHDEYCGFSAQNVLRNIPEAVGMSAGGLLSIQDRAILAAIVNSIKELHSRMVSLGAPTIDTAIDPSKADFRKAQLAEITAKISASNAESYKTICQPPSAT